MDDLELLVDLHKDGARQGPGGERETRLAVELTGISAESNLRVADIGCGTGASTLVLAKALDAQIAAVDFLPVFLERLDAAAAREQLTDRITTLEASMENLPFADESFDLIWSEGAIYNMGFANGVESWGRFLKPGGVLAVSELTWLTDERPKELHDHWSREYPEVDTASAKIAVLERLGLSPLGYFTLPETCWLENYYRPIQQRLPEFLERHGNSSSAQAHANAEKEEIALYERFKLYVSYGFYIASKVD